MKRISSTLKQIKSDLKNHGSQGFARASFLYLFDARFRLILNYRVGHYLRNSRHKTVAILANYYKYRQNTHRNCDISYMADLGAVKFVHPIGIVIGESCIVGDGVEIWQNVTLGTHGKKGINYMYPTIHDNVKIYAGAKIIGNVTIGKGAIIGANSVVLKDVAENETVAGVPARPIGKRTI